jgi:hypothetical protein
MAKYVGNVSFIETKDGSFKLAASPTGKWDADNIREGLKALLAAKVPVNYWSVWVDMGLENPPKGEAKPYTSAQLAALIKSADEVELVLVRRPFPQPKIRLAKAGSKAATSTRREI